MTSQVLQSVFLLFLETMMQNHSSHQNENSAKSIHLLALLIIWPLKYFLAWDMVLLLIGGLWALSFLSCLLVSHLLMLNIHRDISWPKVPEEITYEAYDLVNKLLTENPVQRLGAKGSREVKQHSFFRAINWDNLERQKAMFIPSVDTLDTSYFESRYIWNPEEEHVNGGSDFDDMTDTCSSGSYIHDEDNLSQLASINYDMVVKSIMESTDVP